MYFPEGFFEEPGNELKLDAYKTPTDLNEEEFTPLSYIPQIKLPAKLATALSNEIQEYTGYSNDDNEELFLNQVDLRELIKDCINENDEVNIEEWQQLWLMIVESTERGADMFKVSVITAKPEEAIDQFSLPADIADFFKHLAFVQAPAHVEDQVIFSLTTATPDDEGEVLAYVITSTNIEAVEADNMSAWIIRKDLHLIEIQRDSLSLIAHLLAENHKLKHKPASVQDLMERMAQSY